MNTAERQQFAQHLGALNCFAGVDLNLPYEEAIHTLECIQATLLTLQRINESHLSEMRRRIDISSQEDEEDVSVVTTSEFNTECALVEISDDDSSYVIKVIDEPVASALQVMNQTEINEIESEMMAPLTLADLTLESSVLTPFRIQNAKSVAHSSVISAHEVGELNEKRWKTMEQTEIDEIESEMMMAPLTLADLTLGPGHNIVYDDEDDVMEPLTLDDLTPNENYVPENDNYAEHYTIPPTQEYGAYWKEELHPNVTVRTNKHRQIVSKYL